MDDCEADVRDLVPRPRHASRFGVFPVGRANWLLTFEKLPSMCPPRALATPPTAVELACITPDSAIAWARCRGVGLIRCNSISEGGVGARGREMESLHLGDLVTFELHFRVSAQPIWVDTTIRYPVMHRRTGPYGFQFLSLSEDQCSLIKRYCRLQPLKKRR